jgi:serine/threonine protein kinase
MKCQEIAVAPLLIDGKGSSPTPVPNTIDPSVRLLFQPSQHPKTGKVGWDLFHDGEKVGTHARVGRGLVRGADGAFREIALKLRRDEPLGAPIDPGDASHRFWYEFAYHKILNKETAAKPTSKIVNAVNKPIPKIVRVDEHRDGDEHEHPDVMPSCVVCLHARHALALRAKGEVLKEGVDRGYERRLVRPSAPDDWVSLAYHKESVLKDTLGQDQSACGQCPRRADAPGACLVHVVHINFHRNEFLTFPIWKTNLEQLLLKSNNETLLPDPKEHLSQRLFMAYDVAAGLTELHDAKIWHHDLNPENIVVKTMQNRQHAAIIDLGLSHDPHNSSLKSDERTSSSSNLLPRRLEYAATECRPEAINHPVHIHATRIEPDRARFTLSTGSQEYWLKHDPPVCVDDRLARLATGEELKSKPRLRVCDVKRRDGKLYLWFEGEIEWNNGETIEFVVERHHGPAADLFSFGMVMIAMLLDHPKLELIRRELDQAQHVVASLAKGPDPISPFDLATALLTHPNAFSAVGRRFFYSRLARYGDYEQLARRALGLAFSLLLRGPERSGAVTIDRRLTNAGPALKHVRELLRKLHQEVQLPLSLKVEAKAPSSPEVEISNRRDNASLPADWREFLPFWRMILWNGKPQAKLLKRLKEGSLRFATASRDYVCEFQAVENSIAVIKDFLATLIRFRERRPTGFFAGLFRTAERRMPSELAGQFPAATSALERLRRAMDVAAAWVVELQNKYRAALDRWLKRRSAVEAANLGKDLLESIRRYWQVGFSKAFHAWRATRLQLLDRLKRAFEAFQAWWPRHDEPGAPKPRKMTDTHLDEAASLSKNLLNEAVPKLSGDPMGPAGDVHALWIVNSRGEATPPARTDESAPPVEPVI